MFPEETIFFEEGGQGDAGKATTHLPYGFPAGQPAGKGFLDVVEKVHVGLLDVGEFVGVEQHMAQGGQSGLTLFVIGKCGCDLVEVTDRNGLL